MREPVGSEIELRLKSQNDSAVVIVDFYGDRILEMDAVPTGVEWGATRIEKYGPHFVLFGQNSVDPGEFALETDNHLAFIDDKDDHRLLSVGQSVSGKYRLAPR